MVIRKQIKEFLEKLGFAEEVDDETLDYLQKTLLSIMETNFIQNAFTFKTGAILHQFILSNQNEIQEALEDHVRGDSTSLIIPKFKIKLKRACTYLDEHQKCVVIKEPCRFIGKVLECEIAKESLDTGLKEWT